jgi:hypothetical protein
MRGSEQNAPPTLGLTQHAHDLGLGETALLHLNLLVHRAEKFYFRISLTTGGLPRDSVRKGWSNGPSVLSP